MDDRRNPPTKHETVQERAQELMALLSDLEPSREVSLAKTKIEEAMMWAEKDRLTKFFASGGY